MWGFLQQVTHQPTRVLLSCALPALQVLLHVLPRLLVHHEGRPPPLWRGRGRLRHLSLHRQVQLWILRRRGFQMTRTLRDTWKSWRGLKTVTWMQVQMMSRKGDADFRRHMDMCSDDVRKRCRGSLQDLRSDDVKNGCCVHSEDVRSYDVRKMWRRRLEDARFDDVKRS